MRDATNVNATVARANRQALLEKFTAEKMGMNFPF
jgi:hypothetical protein